MTNTPAGRWVLAALAALMLAGSAAPAAAQNILIIQNNTPWGQSYWYDTLASLGYGYSQIDSNSIASVTLSNYDLVIVPSQQPSTLNTTMNAYMWKFEDYVSNGGGLILMLATYFSETPISTLPFGASATHGSGYESTNAYNVHPSPPIMSGVPAWSDVTALSAAALSASPVSSAWSLPWPLSGASGPSGASPALSASPVSSIILSGPRSAVGASFCVSGPASSLLPTSGVPLTHRLFLVQV